MLSQQMNLNNCTSLFLTNKTIKKHNNHSQLNYQSTIPLNISFPSINYRNNSNNNNRNHRFIQSITPEFSNFAIKYIQQHKCSNVDLLLKAYNRKFSRKAKLNSKEKDKDADESKRGKKFTPEEDEKLRKLVDEIGSQKWDLIASKMPGRNGRQCRDRYKNYLMPEYFSGQWSKEEDLILQMKFKELGPQWSKIAVFLKNRSSNCVKNRWNYFVSKHVEEESIDIMNAHNELSKNQSINNAFDDDIKEKTLQINPCEYFDFDKINENEINFDDDYFELSYNDDN